MIHSSSPSAMFTASSQVDVSLFSAVSAIRQRYQRTVITPVFRVFSGISDPLAVFAFRIPRPFSNVYSVFTG
jgi:hypothetical protein